MAPPSITAFLKNLPPVEDVADLSDSEELPPVCPSRKTFTIAPMRNHPILKQYLHSPSANAAPDVARPLPTCCTEWYIWSGDEVIEDPYWHLPRRSSTWNIRDDRTGVPENLDWAFGIPNPCNRFYEGVYGGQKQIKDAPHDLARVNGSLVNGEPRGLLPSGFRTPNRRRSLSPPQTRAGSPCLSGHDNPDLFEESDRLEDSRDSQLEDAHVENSSQHSLPSDYEFRDFHHPDENLSEHEDGAGAETGDGKADAGYSSWDETPDNNQEELTEGISRPKPTSQSPAIAGPSVERPTPPVDASLLKKILSPRPTESLRYGQPFNSQVSRRAKRPLTEVSGQNTKRAKTKLTRED